MNIIILILLAIGSITSPDQFTAEYQQTHATAIAKATEVANNHQYNEADDGVVIDNDVNPEEFE